MNLPGDEKSGIGRSSHRRHAELGIGWKRATSSISLSEIYPSFALPHSMIARMATPNTATMAITAQSISGQQRSE
jgi:hypothetical protein